MGKALSDVWVDLLNIQANSKESIDYPTQKPEALLKRIIESSTNENEIVLDFFWRVRHNNGCC